MADFGRSLVFAVFLIVGVLLMCQGAADSRMNEHLAKSHRGDGGHLTQTGGEGYIGAGAGLLLLAALFVPRSREPLQSS
jgi:hypothetical protein